MSAISDLLTQYSIETIIIFLVAIGVAIKYCAELIGWFYSKLQNYFTGQQTQKDKHVETIDTLNEISQSIKSIDDKLGELNHQVQKLENDSKITTERLQEQTRSFIIDKHHYYCYQVKAIDDMALQSLERQFLYYVNAGGNTFIENLMAEVRALPKMALSGPTGFEVISADEKPKVLQERGDNNNGTRAQSINY